MKASPFSATFPAKSKSRQRLESFKQPFYNISNLIEFSSFHCIHGDIEQAQAEVPDLFTRALNNQRWGEVYVEPDLYPSELQNFHKL